MKHIASIFIALSLCTLPCFNVIAEDFAALDAIFQEDNEHNENKSKSTIEEICTTRSHRLNCTNLTIRCNDGFVSGMTQDKAVAILCPDETTEKEVGRRRNLQKTAAERFCKSASNMTFNNNCKSNNSVEFGCTEYKRRVESEMKKAMQNYCNADKTNTVFIKDEKTQQFLKKATTEVDLVEQYCTPKEGLNGADVKCVGNKITITCAYSIKTTSPSSYKPNAKDFSSICKNGDNSKDYSVEVKLNKQAQKESEQTQKAAANAPLKDACENGGLAPHGEWNDKKSKCECKEKTYTFDETNGCIPVSNAFTQAKEALTELKSALDTALNKIKSAEQP